MNLLKLENNIAKKLLYAISSLVIMFFLINGYKDNALYSSLGPFLLICVVAIFAPSYNGNKKNVLLLLGCLFGGLIAISNFDSYDLAGAICVTIAASIIGYGCLEFIVGSSLYLHTVDKKWIYFLIWGVLAGIYIGYMFIFNYPGSISTDAGMSLVQINEKVYANNHPFLYTFTLIPFKDNYALYNIIQSIFTSGVIAFGIATIRKPIVSLPFLIIPYYIQWAQTMIKDTLFACFMLLFAISLYRIIRNMKGLNYIWFSIGIVGTSLYRLNGSIAILITLIFSAFILRNKKFIIISSIVMGGSYALKYGIPAVMHLEGSGITETTTLMQQQIAAALQFEDGELAKEADKFLPLNIWKQQYEPFYSDSIKYSLRSYKYIQNHFNDYVKLWVKLGQKYPITYIKAFIQNSRFYYNGAYTNDYRFWTVANMDYPGTSPYINIWVRNIKEPMMSEMRQDAYLKAFLSVDITKAVGLNSWILGGLYVRGRFDKRKETLILVPYIMLLITNIFVAPVPEFRYMLPLFFALPILVPIFLSFRKINQTISNNISLRRKYNG